MKEIILIKNGELALKGLNRRTFEEMLVKNIRRRLSSMGTSHPSRGSRTIQPEKHLLEKSLLSFDRKYPELCIQSLSKRE